MATKEKVTAGAIILAIVTGLFAAIQGYMHLEEVRIKAEGASRETAIEKVTSDDAWAEMSEAIDSINEKVDHCHNELEIIKSWQMEHNRKYHNVREVREAVPEQVKEDPIEEPAEFNLPKARLRPNANDPRVQQIIQALEEFKEAKN